MRTRPSQRVKGTDANARNSLRIPAEPGGTVSTSFSVLQIFISGLGTLGLPLFLIFQVYHWNIPEWLNGAANRARATVCRMVFIETVLEPTTRGGK